MSLDFKNLDNESKWLNDIRPDLSNLSWEQCRQAKALNKTLKDLTISGFEDLKEDEQKKIHSLKGKITRIDTRLKSYKPSFCRIIWQIITLSFIYFKARRLQKALPHLISKCAKIPDPSLAPATSGKSPGSGEIESKASVSITRKVNIVKKALEIIARDEKSDDSVSSTATSVSFAVKRFFEDKLIALELGENAVIGGNFYHCTSEIGSIEKVSVQGVSVDKGTGLVGIISSGLLKGGATNIWGFGVYASTIPEYGISYGHYCFAFDDSVDELKQGRRSLVKHTQLIKKGDRLWATFQGGILINKHTSYLGAPDDDVVGAVEGSPQRYRFRDNLIPAKHVGIVSEIELLPKSVFDRVREYIVQAEDALDIVRLPSKAIWHIENASSFSYPDRYKKAAVGLRTATKVPSQDEI